MYAVLTVIYFIAALIAKNNIDHLIGLSIVAALFAIASGLSAIFGAMTNKYVDNDKELQK